MLSDGFVAIHRKILDNPIFWDAELFQLFAYILLNARWEDGKVHGVEVKRGQFLTGRFALATPLKTKPGTIYKRLKRLEAAGILNIKSNTTHSILTVVNYDTYNNPEIAKEQRKQQRNNNEVTHHNKGNKETKEKEDAPAPEMGPIPTWRRSPLQAEFEAARVAFPGTKRGFQVEWSNFDSKYRAEAPQIVPCMLLAIEAEKAHHAAFVAAGHRPPFWKNFSTWINNRCWEQEFAKIIPAPNRMNLQQPVKTLKAL